MFNLKKGTPLFLSAFCLLTAPTYPAFASSEINWNGFFTLGAGKLSDDDFSFENFDENVSFKNDSNFGLQGITRLNDDITLTVQFIGRGAENDYDAGIEWAYATYELNDDSKLRAGRLRSPFYKYSDYLDVGYAYHWIRPPNEVYGRIPFSSIDGVDYIHNAYFGNWDVQFQFMFGRQNRDTVLLGSEASADVVDWYGTNATFTYDWFEARFSYQMADLTIDLDALTNLANGWQAAPAPFNAIGQDLLVEERQTSFSGVGITLDLSPILIISEYTVLDIERAGIFGYDSWYASFAYTLGNYTVHATYAELESKAEAFTTGVPTGVGLDTLIGLTQGLETNNAFEDSSTTFGVRYDITVGTALKFEVSKIENKTDNAHLYAFAINHVF